MAQQKSILSQCGKKSLKEFMCSQYNTQLLDLFCPVWWMPSLLPIASQGNPAAQCRLGCLGWPVQQVVRTCREGWTGSAWPAVPQQQMNVDLYCEGTIIYFSKRTNIYIYHFDTCETSCLRWNKAAEEMMKQSTFVCLASSYTVLKTCCQHLHLQPTPGAQRLPKMKRRFGGGLKFCLQPCSNHPSKESWSRTALNHVESPVCWIDLIMPCTRSAKKHFKKKKEDTEEKWLIVRSRFFSMQHIWIY